MKAVALSVLIFARDSLPINYPSFSKRRQNEKGKTKKSCETCHHILILSWLSTKSCTTVECHAII